MEKIDGLNYIGIEAIKPYPNNTKKHSDKQIKSLIKLIELVGFNVPIVLDKDNVIISGHGRLMAASKLGMKDIPYVKKDKLTKGEVRIYRIGDNTIAESEGHDYDLMAEEFKKILENAELDEFSGH
ncbi:ParB N-terminal domain-containing protein [candidate division KSB1 bacterium]|nr:ParB N-terminal domain-containing protein [candidate division KSB1 bacterium]